MLSATRRFVSRKVASRSDEGVQTREPSLPVVQAEEEGERVLQQVDQPRLNKRNRQLRTPSLTPPREIGPTLQAEPDVTSAASVKMEEATKGSLQKADQPGPRQKQSRKFRILSPSPPLESTLAVEVVPDVTEENAGECELGPTVQEPGQEWKIPKTKEECDRLVRALFTPPPSSSTRADTGGPPTPSSPLTPPPFEPTTTTSNVSPPPPTGSDIFPFLDDVPTRVPDDGEVTMPKKPTAHDVNVGATDLPSTAEVGRYISTWASEGESRDIVVIPEAAVDEAYAKSKDILDRPAVRQLCLLLAVNERLQANSKTIRWPSYVPDLRWSNADTTRLRRFLRLLNERPHLSDAGQSACTECTRVSWIGNLRVPCVYDAAAMDGCLGCKTHKQPGGGDNCRFIVQASNPECVRWDKAAAEKEQAAFKAFLVISADSLELIEIIRREEARVPVPGLITGHVDRVFSRDHGLLASYNALLEARKSLYSVCQQEEYLVWAWRLAVDREERAYEEVKRKIGDWNSWLVGAQLILLAEIQPESVRIIRDALKGLVFSFGHARFDRRLRRYEAILEARNKSRQ